VTANSALDATSASLSHSAAQALGYWLVASDGGIFSEGGAPFKGSTGGMTLNKPIVGVTATPDGNGYWLVASDGGIFNYGDAAFDGSPGGLRLNKPIVGMAATPDGKGYWLVASDGGIFNYGDASFYGSAGGLTLNKPVVGMAATPDGKGYWLVASDGGIFDYGDAAFYGSTGGIPLNKPIVGMAATPDGKGYWLVASDGGIFNYGDASFYGSAGGLTLNKPVVGMAATPDGKGYWLVASDGGIFNYGDAAYAGSTGGTPLSEPIVGMAPSRISGPASTLVFSTQPGGANGGTAFSTQPAVTVEDAVGDPVTTDDSTVTIGLAPGSPTSGGPGLLSSCISTGEKNGVFTFGGCTIDHAGIGYKLIASDGKLADATSAPFTVSTGPATRLAFLNEPGGATGGSAFVAQPEVAIEDAGGNTVAFDTHPIILAINTGAGALSGCSETTTAGVASFTGCTIDTAGAYTLTATDAGDALSATSSSFNVGTGVASHLAFTTQPSPTATGGAGFATDPVVTVEDAGGNTVTSDSSTVTLAANGGPGALAGCTQHEAAGVITFSGCSINLDGAYTLSASDGSLSPATSNSITVSTGAASQLAFTTEPAAATGGTAFGTQPVVTIQDAGGNTVTTDTNAVTLAIGSGPGTLAGCSATTTAGVASFSGCTLDTAGSYTLSATDTIDGFHVTSGSFEVTVGAASQLAFTTQPGDAVAGSAFGTQPIITIEDAGGNTVTSDTNAIALAISSGTGILSGCSATTTGGVASFSGCALDRAGSFILRANDASDALNIPSSSFLVSP